MSKYLLLLTTMLCALAPCSVAQEGADLTWFPRGVYEGFLYFDATAFLDDGLYAVNDEIINEMLVEFDIEKHHKLRSELTSMTIAFADSIILHRAGKVKDVQENNSLFSLFTMFGVLQYESTTDKLAQALEAGEIVETKRKLRKRPVYSFQPQPGETDIFLYHTVTDQLIIAPNYTTLVAMVNAGMGKAPIVTDDAVYQELQGYIPDTPLWYVFSEEMAGQAHLNAGQVEREGEFNKGHGLVLVGEMETSMEGIVFRESIHYYSEEVATEKASMGAADGFGTPFTDVDEKSRKTISDGNVIIIEYTYTIKKLREWQRSKNKEE